MTKLEQIKKEINTFYVKPVKVYNNPVAMIKKNKEK